MPNKLILRVVKSPYLIPFDDYTKNNVLNHVELDGNFVYLKGHIIYTADTVGDVVTLKKINGNDISFRVGLDTYTTGATYNNVTGVATFTNTTGGTFNLTGLFKPSDDIYTTGFTFNNSTYDLDITRNDGTILSQNLSILASDLRVTGGTYNPTDGSATFVNNSGNSFTVTGFLTGSTEYWISGSTWNGANYPIKANNNSGLDATGDYAVAEGFNSLASGYVSHAEGGDTTASGQFSHAEGSFTTASGNHSHAEGNSTIATGITAHAQGYYTVANGNYSHAEGSFTTAIGEKSHAEGWFTKAIGTNSHAEGGATTASGNVSHAEGYTTTASGAYSTASGYYSKAIGETSHAEGKETVAIGYYSHAEGQRTISGMKGFIFSMSVNGVITLDNSYGNVSNEFTGFSTDDVYIVQNSGNKIDYRGFVNVTFSSGTNTEIILSDTTYPILNGIIANVNNLNSNYADIFIGISSHAEGEYTRALNKWSHAEGYGTTASGYATHAEGSNTKAIGERSHAEGHFTLASGYATHSQGVSTEASGVGSHAEGSFTTASGNNSHAQGYYTTASGYASSASGYYTIASGDASHAEGQYTTASGDYSHSEGRNTTASGLKSHAEGESTTASGVNSHTEGSYTIGSGFASHAQGMVTIASGAGSSASGYYTIANNVYSHSEGAYTTASGIGSHAEGNYSVASGAYSHAEGEMTWASGQYSHSEGQTTTAIGESSHAEGNATMAIGDISHAEGRYTIAGMKGFTFTMPVDGVIVLDSSYGDVTNEFINYSFDSVYIAANPGSQQVIYKEEYINVTFSSGTNTEIFLNNTTFSTSGLAVADINNLNSIYADIRVGDWTHAEGYSSRSLAKWAHSEGYYTEARGSASHAEGYQAKAIGQGSHAEGSGSFAFGVSSHAEGGNTLADNSYSHAEGYGTTASGGSSHSEGAYTTASAYASHAEGQGTTASGYYSHAEGQSTTASGYVSHAEGSATFASGDNSHSEGNATTASGSQSHAEGYFTTASGSQSHAEGYFTTASGNYSHAEGKNTTAIGQYSHAEGYNTTASYDYSHAEGHSTTASGYYSHAEGKNTLAYGDGSHAEGGYTTASGAYSHAEGKNTTAVGQYSHAEGSGTTASGNYSHTEGKNTTSSGNYSHAGGATTIASGNYSFVHGNYSSATGISTVVFGDNIIGALDNTVYVPTLISNSGGTESKVGINTFTPAFVIDAFTSDSRFYLNDKTTGNDAPFTQSILSGKTTSVTQVGSVVDGKSITFGVFGDTMVPTSNTLLLGNATDTFIAASINVNNLNIINLPNGGQSNNIRFYAGRVGGANGGKSDLHIQGDGSTRGYIGINTDSPEFNIDAIGSSTSRLIYNGSTLAVGGIVLLSGFTGIPRFGTAAYGGGKVSAITFGARSWDDTGFPSYGKQGDAFTFSSAESNGLNFLSVAGSGTEDYIRFYAGQGADGTTPDIHIQGVTSGSSARGFVGINNILPTQQLDVNGNGRFRVIGGSASAGALHYTADGSLTTNTSDERLKTNITSLNDSLEKIKQLRGVTYNWSENPTGDTRIGLIAQEVKAIVPELTFVNNNTEEKYMGVHYDNIVALLIEGIKELNNKVDGNNVSSSTYTSLSDGATTPIPTEGAGTMVFDNATSSFYGWTGSVWKKLHS